MSSLALRLRSGQALGLGSHQAPAVPAAARVESAGPRLLNRNFVLLWQAQLVSQFGNSAVLIAMMAWAIETTHSATMSGVMMMAGGAALVVPGPLTGAFARRPRAQG